MTIGDDAAKVPPPRTSIRGGASQIALSQLVRRGFRMVSFLIAARMLQPAVIGVYMVLLTVTELVLLLSGGGYADYLTREVSRDPALGRGIATRLSLLRCLYAICGLGLALALMAAVRFPLETLLSALLFGMSLFPRILGEAGQGIIRGCRSFGKLLFVEAFQGAAILVLVVVFISSGRGLRGLLFAEIGAASCGAFVSIALAWRLVPAVFVPVPYRTLAKATYVFNLSSLIANVYDKSDVFLLSKLVGDIAVGIYSLPYRVFANLQIISGGLVGALLPSLSASRWTGDAERTCHRIMKALIACAMLTILGTMLLARPAVLLVLGAKYKGSDVALQILIWATIPVFLNAVFNTILMALDRERVFILTASVCTFVNIGGNLLLIPIFSFRAAAAMTILTEAVLLAQNVYFVRKTIGHVPMPGGLIRISFVFAFLMIVGLFLQRSVGTVAVGLGVVAVFAVFLYLTIGRELLSRTETGPTC
jgi:O-antigen/teichoic acid export membrane protein